MLAGIPYLERVGIDLHPFRSWHGTRSNQRARTLLLNDAYPAVARNAQVLVIAERGYVYAQCLGSIKNGGSFRYLYLMFVYLKMLP